jgi:hypothetical protein
MIGVRAWQRNFRRSIPVEILREKFLVPLKLTPYAVAAALNFGLPSDRQIMFMPPSDCAWRYVIQVDDAYPRTAASSPSTETAELIATSQPIGCTTKNNQS